MQVMSVNVGGPQQHIWSGQLVTTSIFKSPVDGPVQVSGVNLAGDQQSDLTVHGGVYKAVYVYPHEHYAYWDSMRIGRLSVGNFGENLTTAGLLESDIHIGDELGIGTARFAVTQPRLPCYKLQVRFNRPEMTKLFYNSRRFGFYLTILAEGSLQAGDRVEVVSRDENAVSVAQLIGLYTGDLHEADLLDRAVRVKALSPGWREDLQDRATRARSAAGSHI